MAMAASTSDTTGRGRESAAEWLLSDKYSKLLPTPWLTPYEFEEFVERLLWAQRLLGAVVRHVVKVERWGSSGDRQDGVDLVGEFGDGVKAAWQYKHLEALPPAKVKTAVEEMTYKGAEEFYLVFSRVASSRARAEMKEHPGWTLLDRGQLTAMLRELPLQAQRDILEQTWGEAVRRLFIEVPGDEFVSLKTFVTARRNPKSVMNDLGPMVGREDALATLGSASDSAA
jgi:Restriction endonuclease